MDIDGVPTNGRYAPSKGSKRLSARALGVLTYLHATGAPISAESLSKVFTEGEKAMRPVLKELKTLGFITSTVERIGNRIMTVNRLVDAAFWPPETGGLIQQPQQNSNLTLRAYSYISKKEYFRERKEEHMYEEEDFAPMYLEPEERAEYSRKVREKRDQQYRETRDANVAQRIKDKVNRKPEDWSTDDTAYHFGERVALMWNVQPWTAVRTRFKAALGKARKEYGTTGDIELKMMDRFFENLEHKKHVTNPEIIWKVFIRDFGALLTAVERSTVTPEDLAEAEEILKRQWEKY